MPLNLGKVFATVSDIRRKIKSPYTGIQFFTIGEESEKLTPMHDNKITKGWFYDDIEDTTTRQVVEKLYVSSNPEIDSYMNSATAIRLYEETGSYIHLNLIIESKPKAIKYLWILDVTPNRNETG